VQYVIVGSGPDEERLRQIVDHHGLHDAVHFAGRVPWDDLLLYYNAADVFVMPSREDPPDVEGFGLVFLEANACGTPVIGANAGGVPDAIVDGTTGYLVPPADPAALADALASVLTHPEQARAMGRAGRYRAATVASWGAVAGDLLAHLHTLT
jgi:phosphatidylinositol alpha-1,6-mannosyltransferase